MRGEEKEAVFGHTQGNAPHAGTPLDRLLEKTFDGCTTQHMHMREFLVDATKGEATKACEHNTSTFEHMSI